MKRFLLSSGCKARLTGATLALLLLMGCAARRSSAQFIGYTSPQTVTATPLSNVACTNGTVVSANTSIPNLGQSFHYVTYFVVSTGAAPVEVRAVIQASYDGSSFFNISDQATDSSVNTPTGGQLIAFGQFTVIRVSIQCSGGSGVQTATANYSGTSVSSSLQFSDLDRTIYRKPVFLGAATGSNRTSIAMVTPYGSTSGVLVCQYLTAGVSGSTIAFQTHDPSSLYFSDSNFSTFTLANVTTPQFFVLPSLSASQIIATYTSGGASANTFNCTVLFAKPGAQSSAAICDRWTPINTTANVQLITAPSQQFIRVCSINLVVAAADNVALVEGTGATCGTGTAGMAGGATAATGWNFAANGGIAHGSGYGAVARTATPGDNVCLLVSAAVQVSGTIGWTASGIF